MKKALIICLLLSLFSALGVYTPAAADSPITVRVGIYENHPKVFTDDNGKVSGLWPDIIEYIASQEGWTIQYIHGTWTECLDKLKNGQLDVMMDVGYDTEREQTYILSDEVPYTSWSRVYVRKGSTIQFLPDLDGKTIAVMKDSINYIGLDGIKNLAVSFNMDCTYIEAGSYLDVFKLIDSKKADAGVVSKDFAYSYSAAYHVEPTAIVFQPANLHFAFCRDSAIAPYLKERVDYQVGQLKADLNSVYYQSLNHWMSIQPIKTTAIPGWLGWTLLGVGLLVLLLIGGIAVFRYEVKRKTRQLSEEIAEHKTAKSEIRNLNSRQEAILSAVPDIIAEVDNKKIYTWVNPAGYQFFGEDVIGKAASFYFEGEQDVYSQVGPIFQGDDNIIYLESWQRRRDGEKRLLAWWCRTLKDDNGNVKGALSTARDITELKKTQRAIVETKEKMEAVFASMTDAVFICDAKGNYLDFNNAFATFHRYKNREECARKVDKYDDYIELLYPDGILIPPDSVPIARALRGDTASNVEYKLRRKDTGETWWGSYSFNPIKDKENRTVGAVVIAHDITSRKNAEEELRESQDKFSMAFNSSPDGLAILNYTTQRFLEVNEKWAKMMEYTPGEIVGRTTEALNMFPGADERTDIWQILHEKGRIQNRETTLRTKNGKIIQVLQSSRKVMLQGQEYVITSIVDITEHKKTENALVESKEKLRRIFETVPEGIVLIDNEGIILDANQAAAKLHRYSGRNDIIGKNGFDLIVPKDRENAGQLLKEILSKGMMKNVSLTLLRNDGSEFSGELSAAVITDNQNTPLGVVIVTSDITERKAAQEEHRKIVEYRELDRVKTNLLSTISHELRTPLASIKGYASMLLMYDRKLSKIQKNESIEAIDSSTDRLTELIDHLLDMSRFDAGILKLTLLPVDPQEILLSAISEAKLRTPTYKFTNAIQGKLPEIMADGKRLRQIIDNILVNAVKYSPEHTEITIKAEAKRDEMLVSISDQGRGIPEAEYQKIFERMYRIEQRLQKDPGGLGLGLSLCKALVEGHGGRIWVESVVDKGSTFFFTIPVKHAEKGKENGEKKQDAIKESTRHR